MYVSNMKLLIDVGQLPASIFEEGLANEDEAPAKILRNSTPKKIASAQPYSRKRNAR